MRNMNFMDTDTASELAELIEARRRLLKKLDKCTKKLYSTMGKFATQCTAVREGHKFWFRGKPAVLSGWTFNALPTSLATVPSCIDAYIRTDAPDFINGPEYFKDCELSSVDFSLVPPEDE